jgi:transcriptional regulator GlxA family with amidase domain
MRKWTKSAASTQTLGILLFDQFSNHCLANAVEPLRAANMLSGRPLYDWQYLTLDGRPVVSSSGLQVAPHGRLDQQIRGDYLFVLPSYNFQRHANWATSTALRAAAGRYTSLVAFDTGSWLLAEAGLLSGKNATIHWQELAAFAERFADVCTCRDRFVIDGNRVTCGGAQATFDLLLRLVGNRHGEALRLEVETLFMVPPPVPVTDTGTRQPKTQIVGRALTIMQENLEDPVSIETLAKQLGRSQRDLERSMGKDLGATPQTVYRRLRLNLARKLVLETALPVSEIAIRSGYRDPSALTRALREEFGRSPRDMRAAAG